MDECQTKAGETEGMIKVGATELSSRSKSCESDK